MSMNHLSTPANWKLASLLLLLLGSVSTLYALSEQGYLQDRKDNTLRELSRYQAAEKKAGPARPRQSAEGNHADVLAGIDSSLSRPWESMLDAITSAKSASLEVLRVQSGSGNGEIIVFGRAKSGEEFVAFLQRLRQQSIWKEVVPVAEEHASVTGGQVLPVSFQISLLWRSE